MVLLAGQPIAEATTATYWDPQRNIATEVGQPLVTSEIAESLKYVGDTSTVDVDTLTLLLTQQPENNHPMKVQLDAQVSWEGGNRPEWPRLTDVKYALTDLDAVVKAETVCAMVKIQRGVVIEWIMALIHTTENHRIANFGDKLEEDIYGPSHRRKWSEVTKRYNKLRPTLKLILKMCNSNHGT